MQTDRPAEWNAAIYHQVSNPHVAWGRTVLSDLPLQGNETALDAGCGSGRLTAELLALLPGGQVIAVDRSANMLAEARANLADYGEQVTFLRADLTDLTPELVGGPVDLIFSTATFHWIRDHRKLFRALYDVLKPGGLLSAQCGGGPNLERLLDRVRLLMSSPKFAPYFRDWPGPWEFADDSTTANRLQDAGFTDVDTWIYEAPTPMADAEAYASFLTNVILGEHLARLPETHRAGFIATLTAGAAAEIPPFVLDYWRLNIRARRPIDS